jgi:two-component system response regulator MprA
MEPPATAASPADVDAEVTGSAAGGQLLPPVSQQPLMSVGDVELDPARRQVRRAGHPVDLTQTEYGVLQLLMLNADIVLERSLIYERLWGADLHHSSKSLDVHVSALRRKLEGQGERVIHTVRGVGYVMWSACDSR